MPRHKNLLEGEFRCLERRPICQTDNHVIYQISAATSGGRRLGVRGRPSSRRPASRVPFPGKAITVLAPKETGGDDRRSSTAVADSERSAPCRRPSGEPSGDARTRSVASMGGRVRGRSLRAGSRVRVAGYATTRSLLPAPTTRWRLTRRSSPFRFVSDRSSPLPRRNDRSGRRETNSGRIRAPHRIVRTRPGGRDDQSGGSVGGKETIYCLVQLPLRIRLRASDCRISY